MHLALTELSGGIPTLLPTSPGHADVLPAVASCRCDGYGHLLPVSDLSRGTPLSKADFLNVSLQKDHKTELPGQYGFHPT